MEQAPIAGEVYQSPKHDKYIEVLAIDKEDATTFTLAILWIAKDTLQTQPDNLVVSKEDVKQWTEVVL